MEEIMLHHKLVWGVRDITLAYVVWQHVKVMHIPPVYDNHQNLDEEIIARAPKVDAQPNFRVHQELLNNHYVE